MVRSATALRGRSTVLSLVLCTCLASAACAPTGGLSTSTPTAAPTSPSSPQPSPAASSTPSQAPTPPGTPSTATPSPSPTATTSPIPTPSPTPTSPTPPPPAPSPTPTQAFVADTSPDRGDAQGGAVGYLTDIRMGAHDGYDRVVLEYSGPGTPSWHVRYVSSTVTDPGGNPFLVRGEAFLEATLGGVEYPDPALPGAYDGPFILSIPGTRSVVEVIQSSIFEGQMQTFIGVSAQARPFRVFRLTDPSRVVIDVLHAPVEPSAG